MSSASAPRTPAGQLAKEWSIRHQHPAYISDLCAHLADWLCERPYDIKRVSAAANAAINSVFGGTYDDKFYAQELCFVVYSPRDLMRPDEIKVMSTRSEIQTICRAFGCDNQYVLVNSMGVVAPPPRPPGLYFVKHLSEVFLSACCTRKQS